MVAQIGVAKPRGKRRNTNSALSNACTATSAKGRPLARCPSTSIGSLTPWNASGNVRLLLCMQPIACERRDPESEGIVEASVRYVKRNALAGRSEELVCFEDYVALAPHWPNEIANVRIHETTRERPVDRFQQE